LEEPNGVLIEQALRFAFKASNNQAEYEALIAGMLFDPAGNLNVGESLRNTFCPVFATVSPEESPSELSLSLSDVFKM